MSPRLAAANTPSTLRTQTTRTLTPHFEHKLFLTATLHNGYQESFSTLLELLDNQRFACGVMPNRNQLDAIMVRRLKSELVGWDGKPRFPQRQLDAIEVTPTMKNRFMSGSKNTAVYARNRPSATVPRLSPLNLS